MEINGLPVHALVVHAAVVFGPLAALTAVAYAAVPRWRGGCGCRCSSSPWSPRCRWWRRTSPATTSSRTTPSSAQKPFVETHEERAELLLKLVLAFGPVAVAAYLLHARHGAARTVVRVLLGLVALAVLVQVVLVGDAGARAVWSSQ